MDIITQIGLNVIIAGAIYALIAIGFSLIYSTARFFDMGYGALITVGGYGAFWMYKLLGMPLIPSLVFGALVAGVLGFGIERIVYRPLRARRASNTVLLVASIGVFTVLQAIIAILFSSQFQTLSRAAGAEQTYTILGGVITHTQVLILLAAVTIVISLAFVLKYTRFGMAVRAVADDAEVGEIVGINSGLITGIVFFIGAAIAGIAGIAVGFDTGIQPTMGMSLLLKGVVASIIGGIGTVYGVVLGAFLLAFIENLGAWYFSGEWKDAIAFGVLIVFLLLRPWGVLGRR